MFSTRQAAAKLGLDAKTLSRYIAAGKVPPPKILNVGSASLHGWTEEDIEKLRALLPKIKNGRKTRWQKQRKNQKSAKAKAKPKTRKKPQPRAPQPRHAQKQKRRKSGTPEAVPHEQRRSKH